MKNEKFMLYLMHHAGYNLNYVTETINRDYHILNGKVFQKKYGLTKLKWFIAKAKYGDPYIENKKMHEQIYKSLQQYVKES